MAGMIERAGVRVTESELQKAVIKRAQELGWRVMHPLPGQTPRGRGYATTTQGDGKGFPDLTLVRERIMFVELKAEGKYLSPAQRLWRDWILEAGGEWYMWRPLQWFDNTIDTILGVRLPLHPPPPDREVVDEEMFERLLKACGGERAQAQRVYNVIGPEREAAPPQ